MSASAVRVMSASLLVPSGDYTIANTVDFACEATEVMLDSQIRISDVGNIYIMSGGYWTGNEVRDARTTRVHHARYDGTDYTIYCTARCLTVG